MSKASKDLSGYYNCRYNDPDRGLSHVCYRLRGKWHVRHLPSGFSVSHVHLKEAANLYREERENLAQARRESFKRIV